MRHQKKTVKLGRKAEHRDALLANQVCSLILHHRIKTTLAKAKAVKPIADKMVTLGKQGTLHARRTALATLRQKDAVKKLFEVIAPAAASRNGGYTRIVKLGPRQSDAAPIAFIEWVDSPAPEKPDDTIEVTPATKAAKKTKASTPDAGETKPAKASKVKKEEEPPGSEA